jgi:integration host factor subunit alpha
MAGRTVKRADLCKVVYRQCTLSHAEAMKLVESVLKEIKDCLERGETVKLPSFGSFLVRKKGERMARNPKTGKQALVSARRVLV